MVNEEILGEEKKKKKELSIVFYGYLDIRINRCNMALV
jgi:hypothetical protein